MNKQVKKSQDEKIKYYVNNPDKAYDKLDTTCCLNTKNIKFDLDQYDHADCKDINEFLDCLDAIQINLEVNRIIRQKNVEVGFLKDSRNVKDYNECRDRPWTKSLTKKEHKFLKENL